MARRISSSRPMTGSNLPSRADWVRSTANFLRASYLLSGFWSSTCGVGGRGAVSLLGLRGGSVGTLYLMYYYLMKYKIIFKKDTPIN